MHLAPDQAADVPGDPLAQLARQLLAQNLGNQVA